MASSVESLLIICVGNPSRGDDAVGPLVASQLQEQAPDLCVIETFQLQPEMVDDLADFEQIVIIDAQANANAALTVQRVLPANDLGWCSHALSPEQLAGLYQTAFKKPAPAMVTVGIKADSFELGAAPSSNTLALIPHVIKTLIDLHEDFKVKRTQEQIERKRTDTLNFLTGKLLGASLHA